MPLSEGSTDRALAVAPGERTGYWFGNSYVQMIVTGAETDGAYTLFEVLAPPGDQPPPHTHRDADEAFQVLEGEIEVWAGAMNRTLYPGDFAILPKGVPHTFLVTSSEPARFQVTISPAGFEKFLVGISRPAQEPRLPEPSVLPPDVLARYAELSREVNVEPAEHPGA